MPRSEFMHKRNVFRVPPDYTRLAVKYANFRKVCKLELNGKVSIDLRQNHVLEQLTKVLLEEYFGLKLALPPNSLIPTVPLRLNYILWLEDIVNTFSLTNINGIDIGCGASCVYCLISAKKNEWNMVGLESKDENVTFAKENVTTNNLEEKITIFKQEDENNIFENFVKTVDESKIFDFCLCNPPFFDKDKTQWHANRTANRKPPKNAPTGTEEELSCKGGEVAFIRKIIDESLIYRTRIRFYTTMVGSKTDTVDVINILKSKEITNYAWTEFCQGNVTRWGVAWSFEAEMNLEKVPCIRRSLTKENLC